MQIGEVIRTYRRQKGMTQEEMAGCLGVTTPAVNKWERGVTMPDITLLAPIARLLGVSLEELLSFRRELTDEEIMAYVNEFIVRVKRDSFEDACQWAVGLTREYPDCELLALLMAQQIQAWRTLEHVPDADRYDGVVVGCYERVLNGGSQRYRQEAAASLLNFHIQKGDYAMAEKYLAYYAERDLERQRYQALIESRTNRLEEAYTHYEQLIFSCGQMTWQVLYSLMDLAMEQGDMERARYLAEKSGQLCRVLEMGRYNEVSARMGLALKERDADAAFDTLAVLLDSVGEISSFTRSDLYSHMHWKPVDGESAANVKKWLLNAAREGEDCEFLRGDPRWEKLLKEP